MLAAAPASPTAASRNPRCHHTPSAPFAPFMRSLLLMADRCAAVCLSGIIILHPTSLLPPGPSPVTTNGGQITRDAATAVAQVRSPPLPPLTGSGTAVRPEHRPTDIRRAQPRAPFPPSNEGLTPATLHPPSSTPHLPFVASQGSCQVRPPPTDPAVHRTAGQAPRYPIQGPIPRRPAFLSTAGGTRGVARRAARPLRVHPRVRPPSHHWAAEGCAAQAGRAARVSRGCQKHWHRSVEMRRSLPRARPGPRPRPTAPSSPAIPAPLWEAAAQPAATTGCR